MEPSVMGKPQFRASGGGVLLERMACGLSILFVILSLVFLRFHVYWLFVTFIEGAIIATMINRTMHARNVGEKLPLVALFMLFVFALIFLGFLLPPVVSQ